MNKKLTKIISTFFYCGYFPVLPGTVGALAGLGIYFLVRSNIILYIVTTLFLTILGFKFSGKAESLFQEKDPHKVVIDEVSGILIALFLLPSNLPVIISAFFLFRAFDMIKPPPADKLQDLKGSAGIMLDDVVAGIYTNICFQVALKLLSLRI